MKYLSLAALAVLFSFPSFAAAEPSSFAEVVDSVQPKIVKIYGAGGLKGLEAYQSGFLISSEGHILTVWSYVLDSDYITATLNDGRKYQAEVVGYDPRVEIAVLKIDAIELDAFSLDKGVPLDSGSRVLAFSNLYGVATGNEPASVQHGAVSAKAKLTARRGAFETPYKGEAYILDAMTNNPGAAGGALTDRQGNFAGILGKELRNSRTNIWLNYAIPAHELTASVDDILSGRIIPRSQEEEDARRPVESLALSLLGVTLVPDVLDKTPPFIDHIVPDSAADRAGLKPDDLVLFVNNRIVESIKLLKSELEFVHRDDAVRLTIQRGQQLLEVELSAP